MSYFYKTSATVVPSVTTGSAYAALDVVGSAFTIPLAGGDAGAMVVQSQLIDHASANVNFRVHLYTHAPSAIANGDAWALPTADEDKYIGYLTHSLWISGGGAKMVSQVNNPGLAIYAISGNRNIVGMVQTVGAPTFGNSASPLRYSMIVAQD